MPELGPRGAALWEQLGHASEFTPQGVVAVEACRLADRLERLHREVAEGGLSRVAEVSRLSEARLHAAALKVLLDSPALSKRDEQKGADGIDALAARRAARRSAAADS